MAFTRRTIRLQRFGWMAFWYHFMNINRPCKFQRLRWWGTAAHFMAWLPFRVRRVFGPPYFLANRDVKAGVLEWLDKS